VAKASIPAEPGFPQTSPLVVARHTKATILLDRRELIAAYPELTFSGGRGAHIRLTYQEALVKDRFTKGNRNEVEGKRMLGYSDEVIPDGGKARVFRPLWWRTWRYLEISVDTADEPLSLDRLEAFATGYPFEEQGRWDAGDATLAKIWSTGWRTARLCAHETYVDCPYYEQLQYVGDTRVQALISYAVAGDDRLARQAIEAYDDSRRSDGITSSRYPSGVPQYIPPFSLLWVGMVHDYWMYRDDPGFVGDRLAGTRAVLDFYLARQREDGLVGRSPFWNFVDWAPEFSEGVPPEDADGGSSAITLQFVAALREAADLEQSLGDASRAALYRQRADRAGDAVWRLSWTPVRGLVADTPAKARFSQQANILALWLDVVPKAQQSEVLDRVLAVAPLSVKTAPVGGTGGAAGETGIAKASYYFRFYLARALDHVGRGDDYLPLLDPWREMLDLGLSTFAETPDLASRSDCHAWSAHPNYDLLTIVAGIRPAAPGFKRVRIEPHLGALDHLDAAMPHSAGEIAVSYRRRAGGLRAVIGLPAGLPGELVWHGERHELAPGRNELLLP
ncbi:MAG: alpha-L-rhamnosidase C-terminal domain-containing protein, partial [Vicinamibacteria bacterium]